jgi:hypothetical protein
MLTSAQRARPLGHDRRMTALPADIFELARGGGEA